MKLLYIQLIKFVIHNYCNFDYSLSNFCVIGQGSFVAQNRTFADICALTDITTSTDGGVADFGGIGDVRVRPDDRIFDDGFFFDVNAFA